MRRTTRWTLAGLLASLVVVMLSTDADAGLFRRRVNRSGCGAGWTAPGWGQGGGWYGNQPAGWGYRQQPGWSGGYGGYYNAPNTYTYSAPGTYNAPATYPYNVPGRYTYSPPGTYPRDAALTPASYGGGSYSNAPAVGTMPAPPYPGGPMPRANAPGVNFQPAPGVITQPAPGVNFQPGGVAPSASPAPGTTGRGRASSRLPV
jgi:hypothetical protein